MDNIDTCQDKSQRHVTSKFRMLLVCCKPEEEDEHGNNSWTECDNHLIWYHVLCIPAGHEVSNGDDVRDENDVPYWKCHVYS